MTGTWAIEPSRLLGAAALVLSYALLCGAVWHQQRKQVAERSRAQGALRHASLDSPNWTVAYASQTGSAEQIALHTAQTLHTAGLPVRLCSLDELDASALAQTERLLLVVSTYGEGDPPDNAARFAKRCLGETVGSAPDLSHLHHAVLALGDRSYSNFCGFGRALDSWLQQHGAQPLFDRIEADRVSPDALAAWRQQLSHVAGTRDAPDWSGPPFTDWRLVARRVLNPGSAGEAVCHLELEPIDGPLPAWQSGDLVQVLPPSGAADSRPRDYSIASIPADGRVHLLVRLHRHADGSPGCVSGWLCQQAAVGERVALRVREHRAFQLGANAERPLILIGNGTGMAGLRSHLKARAMVPAAERAPCWLIFGERQAAHDFHHQADIADWQAASVLTCVDAVFSRDQAQRRYVQHRLQEAADILRDWIDGGAALYVCGSLAGMAAGVDEVLRDLLGGDAVDALTQAGRYRRDVY